METENSKAPIPNRIIRLAELMALVGLTSRSAVNRAIREAEFPPPIRLTKRAVGWRLAEVMAWIDSRPHVR